MVDNGIKVSKVAFQASDKFYQRVGIPVLKFTEPIDQFERWLRQQIATHKIDCLILYNEFRPYNQIGYTLAAELKIECLVLELGLLRPDYVTIYSREKDLFNYLSSEWEKVLAQPAKIASVPEPNRLKTVRTPSKIRQFAQSYCYSRFMTKALKRYPHYVDQRTMSFRHHFTAGLRGTLRFQGREKQPRFDRVLAGRWSGKYYLVPLQVHCDSQITKKSRSQSVEQFIHEVVDSFEQFAPKHTKLIFKVHPMDRGYADYAQLIKKLNKRFSRDRLFYLDRVSNPTALSHAIGSIMINSSMGLSSLIHNTPVKTLGKASFDLPGLTHQGDLESFWTSAEPVNQRNVRNFINLPRRTSQGRGTFFQRLFATKGRCKILWPEEFAHLFPKQ